jgi:hypothetical protein
MLPTLLQEVIGLSVQHLGRPPTRLSLLGVSGLQYARTDFASVVWIMNLLPGLHKLNVRLGDGPTIQLLEVLKSFQIVSLQQVTVVDAEYGLPP